MQNPIIGKVSKRIENTIANHEAKELGYARGAKQFAEENSSKQDAINIGKAAEFLGRANTQEAKQNEN
jgi:hypothetical protein